MKRSIFSLVLALMIMGVGSAYTTINVSKNAVLEPSLTILASKDNCTVTSTCPNGSSISCTSATCAPCMDIVINALQSGFCNAENTN